MKYFMRGVQLLWLSLGLLVADESGCLIDEDCNLNGICVASSCTCLQGWQGLTCGELALGLATVGAGLHASPTSNLSSWGGWVGWDHDTKRWQMFANEMVHGCGINSWEANSRVVRASTADLKTPFLVESEIKQPFGSEPTLAQLESGEWLLFSIGNRSSTGPPRTDCVSGYTPNSKPRNGTGGNFKSFVPVEVAMGRALSADRWDVVATLGSGDFNPSPLVFPNGTTLLMWRHLARVHMVRATHWTGPFAFNGSDSSCPANGSSVLPGCEWWHLFSQEEDARGLEDPFMYTQPHPSPAPVLSATHTFHALFHDHKSYGGHAYSRDGVSWAFSGTPPYGNIVNFTDGSSVALQRRERPHLVFDQQGYISHLSTGVQPPPTAKKSPPPGPFQNDYTYTLIQPVTIRHMLKHGGSLL